MTHDGPIAEDPGRISPHFRAIGPRHFAADREFTTGREPTAPMGLTTDTGGFTPQLRGATARLGECLTVLVAACELLRRDDVAERCQADLHPPRVVDSGSSGETSEDRTAAVDYPKVVQEVEVAGLGPPR